MNRIIPCSAVLALVACSGGRPPETADSQAGAAAPDVQRVEVGECAEREVAPQVKEVVSSGAGWSYLAPAETQVTCSGYKALLELGAGLNIVFTSYVAPEGEAPEQPITEMAVAAANDDVLEVNADAEIRDITPGSFGAAQHPGHCGGARFSAKGANLRSLVCSVAAPDANGETHVMLVALTDTEEGFAQVDSTDEELFSGLVDNWSPVAGASE